MRGLTEGWNQSCAASKDSKTSNTFLLMLMQGSSRMFTPKLALPRGACSRTTVHILRNAGCLCVTASLPCAEWSEPTVTGRTNSWRLAKRKPRPDEELLSAHVFKKCQAGDGDGSAVDGVMLTICHLQKSAPVLDLSTTTHAISVKMITDLTAAFLR